MTAFIAEAKRLGIQHIPGVKDVIRPKTRPVDSEGLCVTDCSYCRSFRNKVRAALEEERANKAAMDAINRGLDELIASSPFTTVARVDFQYTQRDMDRAYKWGQQDGFKKALDEVVDAFMEAVAEVRSLA